MQSSYLVATGLKRLDAGWALGESWRQLHPPLAAIVNYGQLSPVAVSGFQLLLGELERVGFGPAAENVGRLLGLMEARILDLSFACAPRLDSLPTGYRLSLVGASLDVPLLIDAVLPTPPQNARSGLIGQLVRRGALALEGPTRTVKVDRAGRPLGATAAARQRLALFGRCTEGWILGNDTLNLAPHEQPQNWARALLAPLGANKVL
jgi:diaminopimelate decarboxylase